MSLAEQKFVRADQIGIGRAGEAVADAEIARLKYVPFANGNKYKSLRKGGVYFTISQT